MSTRSFIYPSPFVSAILAIVLCFILSASAIADRSDHAKDKSNKGRVSERKNDDDRGRKNERDNRDQKSERNNRDSKVERNNHSSRNDRDNHSNSSIKLKNNNVVIKIGDKRWNDTRHNDYPTYRPIKKSDPIHPVYRQTHYTNWVFDLRSKPTSRRSVYFYFGYFPYVQTTRIHVRPYVTINYCSAPIIINNGYYLNHQRNHELDSTLNDIRSAWLNGRSDLIGRHINNSREIAVLLDGRYDYSIDSSDYVDMTADAIEQMKTMSFVWQSVRERNDGSYTAFAKHTYFDEYGSAQTIYVSYTLDHYRGDYNIVEVGSSRTPLD